MKMYYEKALLQMLFLVVVAFVLKKGRGGGIQHPLSITGGQTLAGSSPHPAALSLFSRTGEKIRWKSLWVKINAGRSHSDCCQIQLVEK